MDPADSKARLASHISSLSAAAIPCPHRPRHATAGAAAAPTYVDWYLVLMIQEDAEADMIRSTYRKLALQLHPDKNKHPKAEVAFRLVSEAYSCLSDESRRRAFDLERRERSCGECIRMRKPRSTHSGRPGKSSGELPPKPRAMRNPQACWQARRKLEEEALVIERCLRRHGEAATTGESPLFEPSKLLRFPDYPHCRGGVVFGDLRQCKDASCIARRSWGGGRRESPVYEVRVGSRGSSKSRA